MTMLCYILKETYCRRFFKKCENFFFDPMSEKRRRGLDDRGLVKAEEGSVYAKIIRSIGNNKFEVFCSDSVPRIASIRGKLIKRVWMKPNDILLCSLREGDGKFCDVELKYTDSDIKTLKEGGYITDTMFTQEEDTIGTKIEFSML